MEQKSRLFPFTDYELDEDFLKGFYEKNNVLWLKFGREECPTTKKKHLQCVVYFNSPRTFKSVQKKLKPRHVEIAKGNVEDNDKYVSKGGDTVEYGVKPEQGKRNDLEKVKKKIKEGITSEELDDIIPFQMQLQYGKRLEEYRLKHEEKRNWTTNIIIFSGNLEKCEKEAVRLGAKRIYKEDKYINGYNGEDMVYFHRFNPKEWSENLFMDIIGCNPYDIRVLYGTRNWKPRVIIFITNWSPDDWMSPRDWQAQITLSRRI